MRPCLWATSWSSTWPLLSMSTTEMYSPPNIEWTINIRHLLGFLLLLRPSASRALLRAPQRWDQRLQSNRGRRRHPPPWLRPKPFREQASVQQRTLRSTSIYYQEYCGTLPHQHLAHHQHQLLLPLDDGAPRHQHRVILPAIQYYHPNGIGLLPTLQHRLLPGVQAVLWGQNSPAHRPSRPGALWGVPRGHLLELHRQLCQRANIDVRVPPNLQHGADWARQEKMACRCSTLFEERGVLLLHPAFNLHLLQNWPDQPQGLRLLVWSLSHPGRNFALMHSYYLFNTIF